VAEHTYGRRAVEVDAILRAEAARKRDANQRSVA